MKAKLSYKSKRNIIISVIIVALLAIISTGTYFFIKGNEDSTLAAFTENSLQVDENETAGQPEEHQVEQENNDNQSQENNDSAEGTENNNQNIESEQSVNNEENTNSDNTITDSETSNAGTTTTTTGDVPNEEYVTERIEGKEVLIKEDYLVEWEPLRINATTTTADLSIIRPIIKAQKFNEPTEAQKVYEGDIITYTINVKNEGTGPKTVVIEDEAPKGTSLLEVVTTEGLQETETNKVKWETVLNPGDDKNFVFKVTVLQLEEGEYALNIPNTAIVDGEETNTVKNDVIKPHITIEKLSNPTDGSKVKYNDTITYKIRVVNDGTASQDLEITDNIPTYTEFESVQNDGKTIVDKNGKVTGVKWEKTVPAKQGDNNGIVEVTFKVKVKGNAKDRIENEAFVNQEKTNKTTHIVERKVTASATNYTGKNIILVLDLSSSMLDKTAAGELRLDVLKSAANSFIDSAITADSENTISLITFNYDTKANALKSAYEMKNGGQWAVNMVNAVDEKFVGVHTQFKSSSDKQELKNFVNSIQLKRPLLTNIQAAMAETVKELNRICADSELKKKENVVLFIGDGAPSCTSFENGNAGDNGTGPNNATEHYGFTTQTETESLITGYANTIKSKAELYAVGYELAGEDKWKQTISTNIISGMSSGTGYYFNTSATDLKEKLDAICEEINEPDEQEYTTEKSEKVTISLESNTTLKIDSTRKVILTVSGETKKEFISVAEINNYFNETGRIKFEDNKFIINTTKFPAGSTINLSYYYTND